MGAARASGAVPDSHYGRPLTNKPRPLIGIIVGILIVRPLKGRGLLIMGLHYSSGGWWFEGLGGSRVSGLGFLRYTGKLREFRGQGIQFSGKYRWTLDF